MQITEPQVEQRAWGTEAVIIRTDIHAAKILHRHPGTESPDRGFQMHIKEESHYLLSGRMLCESWDPASGEFSAVEVEAGHAWTVPPCTFHRETALEPCVILEVSDPTTGDRFRSGADYGGLRSMTGDEAVSKLLGLASALRARADECVDLAGRIRSEGLRGVAGLD